jgi:hypothetical protein
MSTHVRTVESVAFLCQQSCDDSETLLFYVFAGNDATRSVTVYFTGSKLNSANVNQLEIYSTSTFGKKVTVVLGGLLALITKQTGTVWEMESGTYVFKLGLVKFGEILFEKNMLKYSVNAVLMTY